MTLSARFSIVLTISILWLVSESSLHADPIKWRKDYNSARKEATEKGKPLFLDFGTEDCLHCRRLDQTTFRDPQVVKMLNEDFIPIKIDAHREPQLTQHLKIQAFPTLIFATNDGKILETIEGYMEAKRLGEHMVRAVSTATPDWMARDFQEATKSINASDYARAVALLKSIVEDRKTRPVQEKARQVLQEIEDQAATRLARAKILIDKGKSLESMDILADLLGRYSGTQASLQGSALMTKIGDSPEIQSIRRNRRASELLALAKEEFRANQFLQCLEHCETLATSYADCVSSKEGLALAATIKEQPERMAKVCDAMNDRMAKMYMALAESWMKKGNTEEATMCLNKIIQGCPNTSQAELAQTNLKQIKGSTIGQPVKFTKP